MKRIWNDAKWEVIAIQNNDIQKWPPTLVSEHSANLNRPAASIFNWTPEPTTFKPITALVIQAWFFVKFVVSSRLPGYK